MAGETNSTNMSLPIPGVGVTAGPTWATDINNCLTLIDAHTHASGSGVQITPSGLNINGDLTFAGNSATTLKKTSFSSQSSALTGTNFLSFISGNLYVNDGSGNQIPITSAGGVAGSPGSIGSLAAPASATYTAGSKLFTWLADSAKSAAMDNGAVTIRETNVASAKGVTLQSASSLAADYSLTLPAALPASTQYFTSSNTGAMSFSSADTIAAAMTSTGASSIASTLAWTSWSPTITSSSGTVTTSAVVARYLVSGKIVYFTLTLSVGFSTTSQLMYFTLPVTSNGLVLSPGSGFVSYGGGPTYKGISSGFNTTTQIKVFKSDNTNFLNADGTYGLGISGFLDVA